MPFDSYRLKSRPNTREDIYGFVVGSVLEIIQGGGGSGAVHNSSVTYPFYPQAGGGGAGGHMRELLVVDDEPFLYFMAQLGGPGVLPIIGSPGGGGGGVVKRTYNAATDTYSPTHGVGGGGGGGVPNGTQAGGGGGGAGGLARNLPSFSVSLVAGGDGTYNSGGKGGCNPLEQPGSKNRPAPPGPCGTDGGWAAGGADHTGVDNTSHLLFNAGGKLLGRGPALRRTNTTSKDTFGIGGGITLASLSNYDIAQGGNPYFCHVYDSTQVVKYLQPFERKKMPPAFENQYLHRPGVYWSVRFGGAHRIFINPLTESAKVAAIWFSQTSPDVGSLYDVRKPEDVPVYGRGAIQQYYAAASVPTDIAETAGGLLNDWPRIDIPGLPAGMVVEFIDRKSNENDIRFPTRVVAYSSLRGITLHEVDGERYYSIEQLREPLRYIQAMPPTPFDYTILEQSGIAYMHRYGVGFTWQKNNDLIGVAHNRCALNKYVIPIWLPQSHSPTGAAMDLEYAILNATINPSPTDASLNTSSETSQALVTAADLLPGQKKGVVSLWYGGEYFASYVTKDENGEVLCCIEDITDQILWEFLGPMDKTVTSPAAGTKVARCGALVTLEASATNSFILDINQASLTAKYPLCVWGTSNWGYKEDRMYDSYKAWLTSSPNTVVTTGFVNRAFSRDIIAAEPTQKYGLCIEWKEQKPTVLKGPWAENALLDHYGASGIYVEGFDGPDRRTVIEPLRKTMLYIEPMEPTKPHDVADYPQRILRMPGLTFKVNYDVTKATDINVNDTAAFTRTVKIWETGTSFPLLEDSIAVAKASPSVPFRTEAAGANAIRVIANQMIMGEKYGVVVSWHDGWMLGVYFMKDENGEVFCGVDDVTPRIWE
jgi:hypothetical protein